MSSLVIMMVLAAAIMHASWNAMLKNGADRFWMMSALCFVQGIVALAALPFLPLPQPESWPFIAGSAVIHFVYQLLLVRTYHVGDFGQTYPIARGSSPLLIAIGAVLFANEFLSVGKVIGVLMVSCGIIALAFQGRRFHIDSVPTALATGAAIAAYSVTDGIGARLAGNAIAYTAWMSVVWMVLIIGVYIGKRGLVTTGSHRDVLGAVGGGIIALTGYCIVVWAMSLSPMGPVSALRETSVVFAAILARVFMAEPLTVYRICACGFIVAGALMLGFTS